MCYKILKAIQVCKSGHLLERQVCWRQCTRVLNLPAMCPEMRCREFFTKDAIDGWPIKIDTVDNMMPVDPTECLLCTPEIDGEYKEKLELCGRANHDHALAVSKLKELQEHAKAMNWPSSCTQEVERQEGIVQDAANTAELKACELGLAYEQIQEYVQTDVEISENELHPSTPLFYYGPTVASERDTYGLNAPEQQGFDASAHEGYIVNWLERSNGEKNIVLWDFPDQ